mgnify:FL=1
MVRYFGVKTVIAGGIILLIFLAMLALFGVLIWYVIRALRKYVRDTPSRAEDSAVKRSLGEALKAHRARCGMTQEFVAQSLGVSRQAVSKWESGASDPSTVNLLALARLYGVSADELLRGVE